jgi:UDP-N-acetylglucosamine transferase subunit ALG13
LIFVTTGISWAGFERLVKKMDEIAGVIDEEVIIQIGSTKYTPKNAKYFTFMDSEQIKEVTNKARLIVCHGGAGTLISALEQGKRIIAIPRLKRYDEAMDDHQREIVEVLSKAGKIMAVYDIENLKRAINSPFTSSTAKNEKDNSLVIALKEYINGLAQ